MNSRRTDQGVVHTNDIAREIVVPFFPFSSWDGEVLFASVAGMIVPDKHFFNRRYAFRRITETLEAKGIQCVHRKVIVELPTDEPNGLPSGQTTTAAPTADTDSARNHNGF